MTYIIGIDIGTTSTKAVAFTDGGKVLGSSASSYSVYSDEGGSHELDPESLFQAVLSALKIVRRQTALYPGLAGVSFSCAFHSLIAIDAKGVPLTRAMTWADLRPSSYAKELKGSEAGRRIYQATGTPVHAMSPLCKLMWLKGELPDLFKRATRFISIKEYIWWRLFGKYQVDHGIASATGLLDIRRRDWNEESLEIAGVQRGQLSDLVSCTHIESALLGDYGTALELPAGLPFIIGGGDGCLANLGSSAIRPGETALTIGTSGAIRMTVERPRYDPAERIFCYILSDHHYVCGGGTNNGGNALQWYIGHLLGKKGADTDTLVATASEISPGCEGLLFLPYLQGERAPVWNADAKGVFFGIRSLHAQAHFMRAILEGVSYSLYQVGTSLEETIGPIKHICASGGFTRNPIWLQLIADIFQKRVLVSGGADASAIGAAVMGFYALGLFSSLDEGASLIGTTAAYEPQEAGRSIYRKSYGTFTMIYDRLKDLM